MGVPASKFGQEIEEEEQPAEGSLPSTPIVTPKTFKLADLDPRSPSENIVRTPIEILFNSKKTAPVDLKEISLLGDSDECTTKIYSPAVKLKNIDPRSPTVDFTRTPIVVPEHESPLPFKLRNKNLDNVRQCLITSPLSRHLKKRSSENICTPPKLLESNIISSKPIESKRKSYVGLLETNLDFIETDLDTVKPQSVANVDENTEDGYFDSSESKQNIPLIKVASETNDEYSTPQCDRISTFSCYRVKNLCLNDLSDPRSPTNEVFRTPLQIIQKFEMLEVNEEYSENISPSTNCDENDDGLKERLHEIEEGKSHELNIDEAADYCSNRTEIVKDFDKKLSNLIYEDEEMSPTVVKTKKIDDGRSRTPLATRNTNTNVNKAILKLKVRDKPRKSIKINSKIPVLQGTKGKGKITIQCENTPPSRFEERKLGKQQWDPNNTLVI